MKQFAVRAFLFLLVFLTLIALFWNSLVASTIWGLMVYNNWNNQAVSPELRAAVLLTSTAPTSTTEFGTLAIPLTFASSSVSNETDAIIVVSELNGNGYFLASPMTPFAASLAGGTPDDVCLQYNTFFSVNPCNSDREFVQALFSPRLDTTHLFSSTEAKLTTAIFGTFRSVYLPDQTTAATPVSSAVITGHIAHASNRSIAYFFDTTGAGYEFTFVNMSDDEIFTVLAGLALRTP